MSSMTEQVTTHNRNVTCTTTISTQSGKRGLTHKASHIRGIFIAVLEIYVRLQNGDTVYPVWRSGQTEVMDRLSVEMT